MLVHMHDCESFAQSEIVFFYFFWAHIFRFDNVFHVLKYIFQLIDNVAISSFKFFDNVCNLGILINSICERMN